MSDSFAQTLRSDILAMAGEGFHTMLRKGIDGHGSVEVWTHIRDMPNAEWCGMLAYWVVDPIWDALRDSRLLRLRDLMSRHARLANYLARNEITAHPMGIEWRRLTPAERELPEYAELLASLRKLARRHQRARVASEKILRSVYALVREKP